MSDNPANNPPTTNHFATCGLPTFLCECAPHPCASVPAGERTKFAWLRALAGRPDLTPKEFQVLTLLGNYAGGNLDRAFPGSLQLANDACIGGNDESKKRAVRKHLRELAKKGYIVKTREGSSVGQNRAAEYRVTVPEWEESQPIPEEVEAPSVAQDDEPEVTWESEYTEEDYATPQQPVERHGFPSRRRPPSRKQEEGWREPRGPQD